MRLNNEQLCDVVVAKTRVLTVTGLVPRRRIIHAVEKEVRECGAWESSDDDGSKSVDPKSLSRAKIDYAISELKR